MCFKLAVVLYILPNCLAGLLYEKADKNWHGVGQKIICSLPSRSPVGNKLQSGSFDAKRKWLAWSKI